MSLFVVDQNGIIGDAASPKGWADLADALRNSNVPLLQQFADEGVSHKPRKLAEELEALLFLPAKFPNYGELHRVRNDLVKLARDCDGFCMVSDGIEERHMVEHAQEDDDDAQHGHECESCGNVWHHGAEAAGSVEHHTCECGVELPREEAPAHDPQRDLKRQEALAKRVREAKAAMFEELYFQLLHK